MIEKLFNSRSETRACPDIAEAPPKVPKVVNQDRSVKGAAQRTANKRGRGLGTRIDGLIHRCDFCDRDATVNCF